MKRIYYVTDYNGNDLEYFESLHSAKVFCVKNFDIAKYIEAYKPNCGLLYKMYYRDLKFKYVK